MEPLHPTAAHTSQHTKGAATTLTSLRDSGVRFEQKHFACLAYRLYRPTQQAVRLSGNLAKVCSIRATRSISITNLGYCTSKALCRHASAACTDAGTCRRPISPGLPYWHSFAVLATRGLQRGASASSHLQSMSTKGHLHTRRTSFPAQPSSHAGFISARPSCGDGRS